MSAALAALLRPFPNAYAINIYMEKVVNHASDFIHCQMSVYKRHMTCFVLVLSVSKILTNQIFYLENLDLGHGTSKHTPFGYKCLNLYFSFSEF